MAVTNPISDVSQTSISVSENPKNNVVPEGADAVALTGEDELKVTVERVDELVGTSGDLIAARIVDVIFKFNIENDKLLLNNVPVELGISEVKV